MKKYTDEATSINGGCFDDDMYQQHHHQLYTESAIPKKSQYINKSHTMAAYVPGHKRPKNSFLFFSRVFQPYVAKLSGKT